MRYTLTITHDHAESLAQTIFATPGREGAAYLLCGVSRTEEETRLLVRDVIRVCEEHYLLREVDRLSISSKSYVPVAKRSRLNGEAVLFVHSHPEGYPNFSPDDDIEEPKLMKFFSSRSTEVAHGSLVFSSPTAVEGRVWCAGTWASIERVRVLGKQFRFYDKVDGEEPLPEFFDRQVRAFGPEIQLLLRRLHVGVVGVGGTGSAVIEQLTRLGVGHISIFDGEHLAGSNVTRVYGSTLADVGRGKAALQTDRLRRIGFGTVLRSFPHHITDEETARHLRDCDLVFGCTDKHAPRGILGRLAVRYLLPVFDLAVKVHSEQQVIRGIWGRVTTLLPGEACLFCRGTITAKHIRAETLPPEQRAREIHEGYAPELTTDEPAVVMFTTAVAAQAVSELLHRLTGFMGEERVSSEALLHFHEARVHTNRMKPKADCLCQQRHHWGRGDSRNFLGLTW